jgi:hypothetical protein
MGRCNLKAIAVSPENYEKLKDLGRAGDNMNSIVTKLIESYNKKNANLQKGQKQGEEI